MPENEDICFENASELADFYHANQKAIQEQYAYYLRMERSRDDVRKKGCAYFAARDFLFENGLTATDCQLNRMAEMLVFETGI